MLNSRLNAWLLAQKFETEDIKEKENMLKDMTKKKRKKKMRKGRSKRGAKQRKWRKEVN